MGVLSQGPRGECQVRRFSLSFPPVLLLAWVPCCSQPWFPAYSSQLSFSLGMPRASRTRLKPICSCNLTCLPSQFAFEKWKPSWPVESCSRLRLPYSTPSPAATHQRTCSHVFLRESPDAACCPRLRCLFWLECVLQQLRDRCRCRCHCNADW